MRARRHDRAIHRSERLRPLPARRASLGPSARERFPRELPPLAWLTATLLTAMVAGLPRQRQAAVRRKLMAAVLAMVLAAYAAA